MEDHNASSVRDRASRLRDAWERTLLRADEADIIDAIASVAASWQCEGSLWRERAHAINRPFPFGMVEASLDAMLSCWAPDSLSQWLASQFPPATAVPRTGATVLRAGFPVSAHILAGNAPLLGWETVVSGLLARSAMFLKLSSRETEWTPLLLSSLREIAPDLADCIDFDVWHDDEGATAELLESVDCVVASGSDETVATLRARTPAHTPFIGYPNRFSTAYVSREASSDGDSAARLAIDCVRFTQTGCLSPGLTFVEADAAAFAEALATAIERESKRFQMPVGFGTAVSIRRERDAARFLPTRQWGGADLTWTVVLSERPLWTTLGVAGISNVCPVSSLVEVVETLRSVRSRIQAIGYAGSLPAGLTEVASLLGVPRVCPIGTMQTPPFGWRDDGRSLVHSLTQWCEVER